MAAILVAQHETTSFASTGATHTSTHRRDARETQAGQQGPRMGLRVKSICAA